MDGDTTDLDALARRLAARLLGALVALGASVVLGEYELTGATPFVAGAVVGFLVAEVVLAVHGGRTVVGAVTMATVAAAAIVWAARISSGHGVSPFPAVAWPGALLAAAIAAWRLRPGPPGS